MGRVINTNSPGKRRSYHMRTIAEIVRILGQKKDVDQDVMDMLAMTVFILKEINLTVEESVTAWEKRGYWKKADDFQTQWMWTIGTSARIEKLLRHKDWASIHEVLVALYGKVADIEVNKLLRTPDLWQGSYRKLMETPNDNPTPYRR
jgi:hypothetical protein